MKTFFLLLFPHRASVKCRQKQPGEGGREGGRDTTRIGRVRHKVWLGGSNHPFPRISLT